MGFKVIRDFIKDLDEKGAVGIESLPPSNFWQTRIGVENDDPAYNYNGGTIKVRLKDDDGDIYYYAHVDDLELSCELALDWGTRFAGACALDLWLADYKKLIGEPRYEKFITKDGRWYAFMG